MKKIDLEAYLEELECSNCHHEGVQGNGGDAYVCPVCQHEGSIYENSFASGELLVNAICPECGMSGVLEFVEYGGEYRCCYCGYEGDIQEDIDNQDYFWDEVLAGYDETDKGEVFDKSC